MGTTEMVLILLDCRPSHQTVDAEHSLYELIRQVIQNRITVTTGDFNLNVILETADQLC